MKLRNFHIYILSSDSILTCLFSRISCSWDHRSPRRFWHTSTAANTRIRASALLTEHAGSSAKRDALAQTRSIQTQRQPAVSAIRRSGRRGGRDVPKGTHLRKFAPALAGCAPRDRRPIGARAGAHGTARRRRAARRIKSARRVARPAIDRTRRSKYGD